MCIRDRFQSVQGPADSRLRHTELEGYQPVSRIGEIVINSFGATTHRTHHTRTRTRLHAYTPTRARTRQALLGRTQPTEDRVCAWARSRRL